MDIIKEVLTSGYFKEKPPVLIDIGASSEINAKWKTIAEYAICLCFDADSREFSVTENENLGYKKIIQINRIVTVESTDSTNFYLTSSPHCSSSLEPEWDKLEPWIFQSLFKVESTVQLKSITINEALKQADINYVDWFKTDSQGTDLRLFLSLPEEIRSNVLAAEFEPGIIDAYKGEDKLYQILQNLNQLNFWLSDMKVMGTQRLREKYQDDLGDKVINDKIRNSPCWTELTYLHNTNLEGARELLLLFVFSLIEKQYGFALEVCDSGLSKFDEPLFLKCREYIIKKLKYEIIKKPLTNRIGRLFWRVLRKIKK